MQIPRRPKELSYTLRAHAEREDAPVFVYRFPTPEEDAERLIGTVETLLGGDPDIMERYRDIADPEDRRRFLQERIAGRVSPSAQLCQTFDSFIVRIENLTIGDEVFDRERHLDEIAGAWKIEVARDINQRIEAFLTELEEGNSPSLSNLGDESTATNPSMVDAPVAGA